MRKEPNILFIITDHTNAISSPARASLMTSLYPSTHGMWDCAHTQRPEWVDVPADRFTYFSMLLAGAGY